MLGRGPQEAGLPGTQGRGAVEETERLFLRAAIGLRPQKARERRDRLDAVGLGGESFAGRTQGRRRAAGPRLGRRQREQRVDVSRRQSHGELELFPRRAQVPAGERPLSVGEREARFDGRARGRRGDRRGACLDLELPDARRDPGRRLPGAGERLAQGVITLDRLAPATALLRSAGKQRELRRREREARVGLGGRGEQIAALLGVAGREREIGRREVEGGRPAGTPRRAEKGSGASDRLLRRAGRGRENRAGTLGERLRVLRTVAGDRRAGRPRVLRQHGREDHRRDHRSSPADSPISLKPGRTAITGRPGRRVRSC